MGTRRYALVAAASLIVGGVVAVTASADPPGDSLSGWPRQIGSAGEDAVWDMALSSSGDVYLAGSVGGAFPGQTPQGEYDAFVARLDKYGKLVWLRQFGSSVFDAAIGIVVSGSSIYVAGQTNGAMPGQSHVGENDGFIARYDSNGNQKWLRQFGTSDDDFISEIAYSNGDVYVVGSTEGAFPGEVNNGPAGSTDLFVTRYSTSGAHELTYQYGTDGYDDGSGIAVSGSDTYVVGSTTGDFPGFMSPSPGLQDAILARFDKSGNLKAHDQIGSSFYVFANDVVVSGSQVYLLGTNAGQLPGAPSDPAGQDAFLIRYDKSANRQWVRQFDAPGTEYGQGVAVRSGKVYITGTTNGAIPNWNALGAPGGTDGFVAKFGTNGIQESARQFGTTADDFVAAIAIRSSDSYGGAVVVAGTTHGTVWGQFQYGSTDAFVATFLK